MQRKKGNRKRDGPVFHNITFRAPKRKDDTTMPLKYLPTEIWEDILSYCSTQDIYHLTLTTRQIHQVANPQLYRSIPDLSYSKFTKFLASMYFYDHKSLLVRSLSIRFQPSSTPLSLPTTRDEIYRCVKNFGTRRTIRARHALKNHLDMLDAVLMKLPNLTFLHLHLSSADCRHSAYLASRYPFQLITFHCSFQLEAPVIRFLESQKASLRHFWFDFRYPGDFLYPNEGYARLIKPLPSLNTVGWSGWPSMDAVRSIIKNGPAVHSIVVNLSHIMPHETTLMNSFLDVGVSSSKITSVHVFLCYKNSCSAYLRCISEHFKFLRFLEAYFFADLTEVSVQCFRLFSHFNEAVGRA